MPKKKLENFELVTKYIESRSKEGKLSEGTIKTYKNIGHNLPFNILTSQPTILRKLEMFDNVNTLMLNLNMIILLRRHHNEEVDKLIKYRNSLRDKIIKGRKAGLKDLGAKLPSLSYITDELKKLTGKRFIINYLMINNALRNKDLNLKFVSKLPDEKTENYIILKNKTADLYITDYKTESTYGDKKIEIKDPKFISELRGLKLNDGDYLLPLQNGSKINSVSTFNDKIVRLTIDGLGQNKIVKIVIRSLLNNKSFDKLEQISKDRGTSLETLLKSYNLHNNGDKSDNEEES